MTDQTQPESKTARKKDAERLQALGLRLTRLSADELSALPVPEDLAAAIADYQRFRSREAKRRQLQFVGRLMRAADHAALEAALDELEGHSASAKHLLHQAEQWRSRLLEDPAALTAFVSEHPSVDRQRLRQLIKRCHSSANRNDNNSRKHTRELYRFIRDVISGQAS